MRFSRFISTIDAHAAGEPLRIVLAGAPPLRGRTILERRAEMLAEHDHLRRVLCWEPRGHADMYSAIVTPPVTDEADYGVLFLTNEGYSTMCGHGIVALTTALIETGHHPVPAGATLAEVAYDSPAGLIRARATIAGDRVVDVTFANVPSFRLLKDLGVTLANGRRVTVDLVYGGAFYALVDAATLGTAVVPARAQELIALGMDVKRAVMREVEVVHPEEPGLRGLYGTIITDRPRTADGDGRNIVVFAESEVDRSPCGTGTSARLAAMFADGAIDLGQRFVHESVIDTQFHGRVVGETTVAGIPAVLTEIGGCGFITGFHHFVVDPEDPTRDGFLVR
jgi:proline racemase